MRRNHVLGGIKWDKFTGYFVRAFVKEAISVFGARQSKDRIADVITTLQRPPWI